MKYIGIFQRKIIIFKKIKLAKNFVSELGAHLS